MDLQSLRKKAARERFPFLNRHVSAEADIQIQPIKVDLADERPKRYSGESDTYGWINTRRDIFLLNEAGEKLGTVGEVPKLLPTKKLWGIILRREKMVVRKIPETTQEALNRVEGVFYILVINSHSYHGDKAEMYVPPGGQTAKTYLVQLLTEVSLKEELRLRKVEEERIAASEKEQRENQEALDAEVARINDLLR